MFAHVAVLHVCTHVATSEEGHPEVAFSVGDPKEVGIRERGSSWKCAGVAFQRGG